MVYLTAGLRAIVTIEHIVYFPRGGTWTEVVEGDLRTLGLEKDDALDKKKMEKVNSLC